MAEKRTIWNPINERAFAWDRDRALGIDFHDGLPNDDQPGIYSVTFTCRGLGNLQATTDAYMGRLRQRRNFRLVNMETKKFVPTFVRTIHYEIIDPDRR